MSEFWHRYWHRLAGARPRPEPAALKVSASAQAVIDAKDKRIAGQAVELADAATLAGTLREQCRHSLGVIGRQAGEIRDLKAEADTADALIETLRAGLAEAGASAAGLMPAGMVTVSQESLDARTARAEQAEATAASLRDDNASLCRYIAAAVTALRPMAERSGMTHDARSQAALQLLDLLDPQGSAP